MILWLFLLITHVPMEETGKQQQEEERGLEESMQTHTLEGVRMNQGTQYSHVASTHISEEGG